MKKEGKSNKKLERN